MLTTGVVSGRELLQWGRFHITCAYVLLRVLCVFVHMRFVFVFMCKGKIASEWLGGYSFSISISCGRPSPSAILRCHLLHELQGSQLNYTSVVLFTKKAGPTKGVFACLQHWWRHTDCIIICEHYFYWTLLTWCWLWKLTQPLVFSGFCSRFVCDSLNAVFLVYSCFSLHYQLSFWLLTPEWATPTVCSLPFGTALFS